jgi:7-cyano-7-deazaguanine reductase
MKSDTSALTMLGHSESRLPTTPDQATLETFENRHPQRDYWINLDTQEFSSLCPVTGQPDMARIQVRYVPDQRCVETKSYKFYLASFRNQPAFNEDIVNRILTDLVAVLGPRRIAVRGTFSPRGGVQLSCQACQPDDAATQMALPPL